MGDLFGYEAPEPPKAKRKPTRANGYAWAPGTGPKGETCGSCRFMVLRHLAKSYRKCGLVRERWTGGPGTDVRARSPACLKWSPKQT